LPELPLVQPEKVVTLPLDINLNKDYQYEYAGREKVSGYDCYVLEFKPVDPTRALYQGRIWIETRTFARVKMSIVQNGLAPPITSNDDRDFYEPISGPDGTTYWLLSRVEGQQIYSTAGRNLVLLREIDLRDFFINDPQFEGQRRSAYASDNRILRDTEKGFRYLDKSDSGERVVRDATTQSTLFGVAGIFSQPGFDFPVPLVGVNYFSYGFKGREMQVNAFVAGALNTFTLTNPRTFGKRIDTTVEVLSLLPNITDRPLVGDEKRDGSNIDVRTQSLSASLGLPLGNFFRLKATYGVEYANHSRDKETDPAFLVPVDTFIHSGWLEGEFNRSGWTVSASAESARRASWEPWGDATAPSAGTLAVVPAAACDTPGSCLADYEDGSGSFRKYELSVSKQFFLPLFQKIRFEGIWHAGSDLDRFSEFQFSYFGSRVRGFSGSGVRFDRGGIGRLQYSFNVADVIRFDASFDHGYVRDGLTSEEYRNFTGFGLSGNLMGPWETVLQFDLGFALRSDIEDLKGDKELLIGLLKLF
ncbi:MAG: sigma-E factor regulatory protein RseB domain-containing protein, partial [Deltaproteobacteria bacterium]|nr:sigma-E factor regulatory protein RseB domain-containing protein [Deltaproteobacteria bacterium]